MIANHIHDALSQVQKLQDLILEKRQFTGYSGRARMASGVVTLGGASVLGSAWYPQTPGAHLLGWGAVLLVAVLLNYVGVAYWFFFDADVRRNPRMLKPALDAIPALVVGGALSAALMISRQYDLLFGVWMCLYGLAQVAYRLSLPAGIYRVGLCYIACGLGCLLAPQHSFLNPWPMGIAFFL
ncbi:MAG: hypothetical protein V2A34_03090, partial [Lentisphaerota bacterium]